jgi:hypothetical protein
MEMVPVQGAWGDAVTELRLREPEMNPMSLVMHRDEIVVGEGLGQDRWKGRAERLMSV